METMMHYKQLYAEDPRFHRYVNTCAKADGITVEDELMKKNIRNVGDYYEKTPVTETEKATMSTMSGGGC